MFDELVGQEGVVAELRQAVTAAQSVLVDGDAAGMTHAWLFTGPPGSGRSVAARAFTAALQCDSGGCGECDSCRQVRAGSHPDVEVVRPSGLSYGVRETRELVLRAAGAPVRGRWRIMLFEDADRATEHAANALLKAIEEPSPRTVWLLCAPSPDDLVTTIRSRCRLVTLRTPPAQAVADVLVQRDGIEAPMAAFAARAAQGHIGRARRLARDEHARMRRDEVLSVPLMLDSLEGCITAAAQFVEAAEAEAAATTAALDQAETTAMRQAYGEGSTGKGRGLVRGSAGALRDLEERQKSRTTRIKRDALDVALLDLAGFYRDVLAIQVGAGIELANADRMNDLRAIADGSAADATLRRLEAIMECRERLAGNANPLLAVEALTLTLRAG